MASRRLPEAWILYDGLCGLCDRSAAWVLARDRRGAFRFAPLQGETAEAVRSRHPALPPLDETMVLVEAPDTPAERGRVRSDAALEIPVRLGGLWRLATILRVVPRPLRDAAYRLVARRRKRWFGELASCRVPSEAERARFLP